MIRIWPVDIEPRTEFTKMVGKKQDRLRALVIVMLPTDGTCFGAAEVAKRGWPEKNQERAYQNNYRALYDLAYEHGITTDPGPDNLGEDGKTLPGKRKGSRQPAKWTAKSWRTILSDEAYDWCVQTMTSLRKIDTDNRATGCQMNYFFEEGREIIQQEVPAYFAQSGHRIR